MMTMLAVREFVGTVWLILTFVLWGVLGWYVWERLCKQGWASFRADLANHAAIGMLVYTSGELCARIWSLIFIASQRAPNDDYEWSLLWFGSALGMWGAICLVRVFAPRWSNWVAATAVILLFSVMVALRLGMYRVFFG